VESRGRGHGQTAEKKIVRSVSIDAAVHDAIRDFARDSGRDSLRDSLPGIDSVQPEWLFVLSNGEPSPSLAPAVAAAAAAASEAGALAVKRKVQILS